MITILSAGSRGDFQPYIALAQQIKAHGKEVRIAGPSNYIEYIKSYGIDYHALNMDMDTLGIDPKLLKDACSADNPLKMLLTFNKMKDYGIHTTEEYYEACKGSELIIYHPGCTIGYFTAEQMGIPSVLASPFPMHKTDEHLSVVMYGKFRTSRINISLSYKMLQGMLWMAGGSPIKSFWKKRFGTLPDDFRAPFEKHNLPNRPALVSCSSFIFPRPADWSEHIHQKGYWFVDENKGYEPDSPLKDFLSAGEKPVYIGFGSMAMLREKDENLLNMVIDALRISGKRGVISGFGRTGKLDDQIFALGSIPHSWLFNQVSAVCHHGGAGTSAAGFRAGVPSIIVPFSNDQFAWAHRAYDLGVGSSPLPKKKLTAERLAEAISSTDSSEMRKKAEDLGKKISEENGAAEGAKIICQLLDREENDTTN